MHDLISTVPASGGSGYATLVFGSTFFSDKIVFTPTYYVFKLYVPFQHAMFVPISFNAGTDTRFAAGVNVTSNSGAAGGYPRELFPEACKRVKTKYDVLVVKARGFNGTSTTPTSCFVSFVCINFSATTAASYSKAVIDSAK
jgi:hypothetical protein